MSLSSFTKHFYQKLSKVGESKRANKSKTSLYDLPDSILIEIFSYLDIDDRKNVRLTDRRCYRATMHGSLSKDETIRVVHNSSVLAVNDRRRFNVYFDMFFFWPRYNNFCWPRDMRGVVEITCTDSCFGGNGLELILSCCPNLESIHFSYMWFLEFELFAIERLANSDFQHKNLRRMGFSQNLIVRFPSNFEKIFQICPRLRHLQLDDEQAITTIEDIVPYDIKTLEVNCVMDEFWLESFCRSTYPNLTVLKYKVAISNSDEDAYIGVFKNFPNLEELTLIVCSWKLTKKLLFGILKNCPKLRKLVLQFSENEIVLSKSEHIEFVSRISKLQKLRIPNITLINDSIELTSLSSTSLRSLSVGNYVPQFVRLLLEKCSLKHLQLYDPCDKTLQTVWRTQPDLESLELECLYNCSEAAFEAEKPDGPNIQSLKKLKYLCLQSKGSEAKFESLQFLNLLPSTITHFRFECILMYDYHLKHSLQMLPTCLPNLQALSVKCSGTVTTDHITEAVRSFRNLRTFVTDLPMTDVGVATLFCKYRKLRNVYLQLYSSSGSHIVYKYNERKQLITLDNVVQVSFPDFKSIKTYKMDDFTSYFCCK